jgi:hypothetical protein
MYETLPSILHVGFVVAVISSLPSSHRFVVAFSSFEVARHCVELAKKSKSKESESHGA